MRFSVVVPVYNVEKYIGRCLDSLLTQSFSDYEIIVVDDETPDNSMAIVEQRAAAYPGKIRILHQQNKGLGGARNTGAAEARGEYLMFLDSDDFLCPDALAQLDDLLREEPCQILIYNHREVNEVGTPGAFDPIPEYLHGVNIQTHPELLLLPPAAWNRVCLRSFYEARSVPFPEKTLYEDAITRVLLTRASSVRTTDRCIYQYVQRRGSIMHQKITPRMLDILKVTEDVLVQLGDVRGESWYPCLEMSLIRSILSVLDQISAVQPQHPMAVAMAAYIFESFPDYARNPQIPPVMLQALQLLQEGKWDQYHRHVTTMARKRKLLGNPLIRRLNHLRRNIRRKVDEI